MPYKMLDAAPATRSKGHPSSAFKSGNDNNKPHILFLRHKNPSGVGGIQKFGNRLVAGLSEIYNTEQVCWLGPEWGTPFYFPTFYFKAVRNGAAMVLCDDAVTSLIGEKIKRNSGKKVISYVHGLDVILPIPWYQERIRRTLGTLDKIICLSHATAREAEARGVAPDKIAIIPGIAAPPARLIPKSEIQYDRIEQKTGFELRGKKVLISIGRPVKRKGFDRFITDVFPFLPEDCVYIVAGPRIAVPPWIKLARPFLGKNLSRNLLLASGALGIHDELLKLSDHPRVLYINGLTADLQEHLLGAADLFIMPNRHVDGDMEGFGLVAIEAAIRGLPVVATGIEGITDAVIDGQNGFCVPEGDCAGMARIIKSLLYDHSAIEALRQSARDYTMKNFSPGAIMIKIQRLFDEIMRQPEYPDRKNRKP